MAMPSQTSRQIAEGWARREMQAADTRANRDLMAIVTNRVSSLFVPEQGPGRVTAADWERLTGQTRPAPFSAMPATGLGNENKSETKFDTPG